MFTNKGADSENKVLMEITALHYSQMPLRNLLTSIYLLSKLRESRAQRIMPQEICSDHRQNIKWSSMSINHFKMALRPQSGWSNVVPNNVTSPEKLTR